MKLLFFLIAFLCQIPYGTAQINSSLEAKKQHTQEVFNQLIKLKMDEKIPLPSLEFSTDVDIIAYSDRHKQVIGIEELAYNTCMSFGENNSNALAALISHEIVHYYEHADTNNQFFANGMNIEHEEEADFKGIFLAHAAGYETIGIMPKLINALYDRYWLTDKQHDYPSKQDRISVGKKIELKSKKLVNLYDFATYAAMLRKYDIAHNCYKEILEIYPSKEIYNNLSVCLLYPIVNNQKKYRFPLMSDTENRIRGSSSSTNTNLINQNENIDTALQYLKAAVNLNSNYLPAYLNMTIAYILQEKLDKAKTTIKKTQEILKENDKEENQNYSVYIDALEKIINSEEKGKTPIQTEPSVKNNQPQLITEYLIDNGQKINLNKYPLKNNEKIIPKTTENIVYTDNRKLKIEYLKTSKILSYNIEEQFFVMAITSPDYPYPSSNYEYEKKQKKTLLEMTKDEIEQIFGVPKIDNTIETTKQGQIYIYKGIDLMIEIEDEKVKKLIFFSR